MTKWYSSSSLSGWCRESLFHGPILSRTQWRVASSKCVSPNVYSLRKYSRAIRTHTFWIHVSLNGLPKYIIHPVVSHVRSLWTAGTGLRTKHGIAEYVTLCKASTKKQLDDIMRDGMSNVLPSLYLIMSSVIINIIV